MNYGKKSPSHGTPSVYSHITSRSTANLRSSRSIKSLKTPWYHRPIIQNSIILDVQRSAVIIGVFSLLLSIFTIITNCFDLYCYAMAAPGSVHYGYYVISYDFVYVGNRHVRNALIMFAVFTVLTAVAVFVTSIMLILSLRQEYEKRMVPWLFVFAIFTILRFLSSLFFAFVNDLIFAYNIMMVLLWIIFLIVSIYGWILVYSLYIELSDLSRLEDLAHLRFQEKKQLDGHHAIPECIDCAFPGGFSPDDTPQYCLDYASELKSITEPTTSTIEEPSTAIPGPSRSISFFTDVTEGSTATRYSTVSTIPIT